MSVIFGEYLVFHQEKGPDVELVVYGDEFYARYETTDSYTVVYDVHLGLYCYADVQNGYFISTAAPLSKLPPVGLRRHLQESPEVRSEKFQQRYGVIRPKKNANPLRLLTFGPNRGLLDGRRLSEGEVRGLTILVEFADLQSTVTVSDVDDMLNGTNYTANGNFCSVREYFRLLSNGKLNYVNVVKGPVRLSRNQAYYKDHLLVKEALDVIAGELQNDFSLFDSKGERVIDAINFLYAGRTVYEGELWPHNFTVDLQYGNYRTDMYMLTSMGRSRVDLSIGTFCHETGHLLCRFPDLYDYGQRDENFVQSQGIGVYCLMGSGNHLDRGCTPSPVCGYLRDLVGWTPNQVLLNNTGIFEVRHGGYGTLYKYETSKPNEYFIIENRTKMGLDSNLPSSGLAVYHCDWLGSNEWEEGTANRHYQCGLLQADGHLDLEKNINPGDDDLFVNKTGIAISNQTMPSTRSWDGSDSGLIIGDISPANEKITVRVGAAAAGNFVSGEVTTDELIPDNQPAGIKSSMAISERGKVKSIKARVSIIHPYIGDLQVELIAPSGKRALLHNRTGMGQDDLKQTWDSSSLPALASLIDESIQGTWVLAIRDLERRDTGRLNWWGLTIEFSPTDQKAEGAAEPDIAIPDNDPQGIQSTIAIGTEGKASAIRVSVEIRHTYRGDLLVELVAPSGRSATLHNRVGVGQDDLIATYEVSSAPALAGLLGETIQGNWMLRVKDLAAIDTGKLKKWALTLFY